MSEGRRGFKSQIWGSLSSPKRAFESIRGEDLRRGLLLVIIVSMASAYAGYNYASKLPVTMPVRNISILYALRDGLRAVIGWIIPSALIHIFASIIAGKGSFRRMMAQTGFASIPLLLQETLRLLDAFAISREGLLSVVASRSLGGTPAMRLLSEFLDVFTVFGLWAFALTAIAVAVNYGASAKRTVMATLLAYLAFILLRFYLPF
ncbi:MAG: Yip1 family protein [Candidatus Bathyarchaeia archaeon]